MNTGKRRISQRTVRRINANMNRLVLIFIVAATGTLLYFTRGHHGGSSNTIEYQGEHFKLAKSYWSYDDYKGDPNNLDSNEISRIETVMCAAKINTDFDTREQLIHAVFDLRFPGYGLEAFGEKQQSDGSSLSMFSVEIPQRNKDRYFVARISRGRYRLVDDFVANSASNVISRVKLENVSLRYYDANGLVVREHRILQ